VVAIENSSSFLLFSDFSPDLQNQAVAMLPSRRCHVLAKALYLRRFERTYALNDAILREFCQWQNLVFHRFP
jgi:hypothetical protein